MTSMKALRGPVRSMFTKALKEFEDEISNDKVDQTEVEIIFKRLENHFSKLTILDQKIETEMVEKNASEDDISKEYESSTSYRDKFTGAEVKFKKIVRPESELGSARSSSERSNGIRDKRDKYRLPQLEYKKFSGDPREYLRFWAQFRGIHENPYMEDDEKFQYLIQYTVDSSPARKAVERFHPTKENYKKAVEYLKTRFGQDELLVEIYIRDLLRHVLNNSSGKTKVSVVSLYDELETQLQALETLKVTRDKYAAMLYPLVESALPEELLRTWERVQSQSVPDQKDKLTRLMNFLKDEVNTEVRVNLAKEGFGREDTRKPRSRSKQEDETPTAVDLYSGSTTRSCLFCDKSHPSQECNLAQKQSYEDKIKVVKEKRACFICLNVGHGAKRCKAKHRCLLCGGRHHAITCSGQRKVSKDEGESKKSENDKKSSDTPQEASQDTTLANQCRGDVFLPTLLVNIEGSHETRSVRAILDTGAQRSYITEKAARVLGLVPIAEVKVDHRLFGGKEINHVLHKEYRIEVSNPESSYSVTLDVLDQPTICQFISSVKRGPWLRELQQNGIIVTDVDQDTRDIHLLLAADVAGKLLTGRTFQTKTGPVGVETKLGWTVMGKYQEKTSQSDSSMLVTSMHVNEVNIQDLWRLDLIGIKESSDSKSKQDLIQAANEYFLENIKVDNEGRYEIALPWIEGHPPVPTNRELAEKRLIKETKKLESTKMYDAYDKIFKDWLQLGIIEEVGDSHLNCSYLPHRPVIKLESSSTPVRPVFDASAKPKDMPSLNQCLEKGENLIELIPSILTRFRMKKYGIVSDICKAFLQISVRERDRDFLRFLWWENGTKKLKVFRHCRVVFGLTSSPYLLAATLNFHLDKLSSEYPTTTELLKKGMYVDNCLVSVDSEEDVKKVMEESTALMNQGKFELHGWIWNSCEINTKQSITPVLGLQWNTEADTLSLDLRSVLTIEDGPITKRKILSQSHKIFDPIGFSCPVTLIAKKLVQDIWKTKAGWDEPVPAEMEKQYLKWRDQLSDLNQLEIPRWISKEKSEISLHVFSDASAYAYATCVFMRCESSEGVTTSLVMARNRLATIKKITIPRLELLACLIGARLCHEVKRDLGLEEVKTYYWTDSTNALYWIKKNENWAEFVWNRVKEIRSLSAVEDWFHVAGENNPADLPSRGCSVRQLLSSAWWEGPNWLHLPEHQWPRSEVGYDLNVIQSEKRKTVVSYLATDKKADPWYLNIRDENGQLKFKEIIQEIAKQKKYEDDMQAELEIIRMIQEDTVAGDDKKLKQFHAVKDGEGIWRVRTRIMMRNDSHDFRYPMLLSGDHPLTRMLVEEEHKKMYHCGLNVLLVTLREKYWILKARQLARKVIHACQQCRKFEAKRVIPEEAPLPVDRVRDAAVFEITGIDLGGPLYLKDKQKAWFVVFTCAVYRAVHLELVTSLSTKALVAAMERFIARRICPAIIYSDNGTNLIGVRNEFLEKGVKIEWKLNPPAAPWWGGWWERVVGMVKKLLVRILGMGVVEHEEMTTILACCEMVINARPLTYLSQDPTDISPLTPAHFLRDQKPEGQPQLRTLYSCDFGEDYKRRCKLLTQFKKCFRDEYLSRLSHQKRTVSAINLKEGDLVMIEVENKKRICWPLARVLELYPGKDGVVRVVKLQTDKGVFTRPVQRIFLLEAAERVDQTPGETETREPGERISKFGRRIVVPDRFSF